MDNGKLRTFKIIAATLVVLLAICLAWVVVVRQSNSFLNERLGKQESEAETLQSEKQAFQKDIDKSRDSIATLEKQKAGLDELLEHKTEVLTTQTRENKSIKKALRFAEERYKEEVVLNSEFTEKQLHQARSLSALDSLNRSLTDSIDLLTGEIVYLKHKLDEAITRTIDQTLISGVKRNNTKVTSKARAAKKLVASVEVPGRLNNLRFVVERPDGETVLGDDSSVSARILENDESLTASASDKGIPEWKSQNIEITYAPDGRLKAGTYTFRIFNGEHYVGSMKVNLR